MSDKLTALRREMQDAARQQVYYIQQADNAKRRADNAQAAIRALERAQSGKSDAEAGRA